MTVWCDPEGYELRFGLAPHKVGGLDCLVRPEGSASRHTRWEDYRLDCLVLPEGFGLAPHGGRTF